jgi:hypothetical protein
MRSLFTLLFFLFFLFDLISQPTFQKRIGNAADNRLGKVIFHANNYYVLGKNDTKATVSKLNMNGNLLWTNQTDAEAFWNDIIVNKDGNLMVVGSLGSNQGNTINNASLCGVINTGSGAFTVLKSFQIGFRELLNRIYINPVPNNNSFPYYVVGTKTSSSGSNDDDLAILTFDTNFNFGSGKTYTNGSDDDQLHYDVFFGGTNGAMMAIGNNYNGNFFEGRTATIGKDLVPLSGRDFGQSVVFFSGLSLPNSTGGFQQILAGTTTSGPSDAVIIKANGLTTIYSYKIPALDVINYMSTGATGNIFAIGRGEFGGITKTVILNLQDNNTSLTLNWAKVLDQGETVYSNGYLNFILPDKLMITDSRLGGNAVIGDFDGLFCVEQNNLENCMDVTVNVVLVANQMNITEWSISSANIGNITFTNETGALVSYQATNPCAPPCNITSQIQNQNTGCGLYQFQIQSAGGTGPYSYQWDFNCDGTNEHTGSLISHSFSNPGTQQYCITVTDAIGCTATDSKTIVVVGDFLPPVITCPPHITVECADDILADLAETGNATATDDVDPNPDLLYEDNIQGTTCSYISTRIWTATDNCQRTNSCTQLITVIDRLAPEIVCPPNLTLSCDADLFDNMITGNATAFDRCGNSFIITSSLGNGQGGSCNSIWPKTYTATDICGNSRSCTQTITLRDNVPPVILCPTDKTISCEQTPLPTLTGTAVAEDNCQTNTLTPTYTDMNTGAGCEIAIIRTWTINDGCGNISSCQQTIQFDDFLPPNMVCPPDVTISCETPADQINTGIATASDNCQTNLVIGYSDIVAGNNCNKIITRFWNTNDGCGNPGFCYQVITQIDITAPTINCPPNTTISCNAITTPTNTGMATASDNCTENINIRHTDAFTAQGCTQGLIRTWTAMDECENVNTCIQTITLIDDIKPNVVCPPDLTISCGTNNSPAFTGEPTVSDFCQSDLIVTYQDTSSGPPCDVTIIRTWTINDGCGNVSTCNQIIKLEDKSPPTFICPPSNINPIECTADPSLGAPSNVMDNCGGKIDQTKVDVFSTDGCFTTVTRTWTVTDQCGNNATCDQVILMQDTKAPVITNCGRKFTVQGIRNPDGICYGNATISTPDASDECSENVMITNSFNNSSNASSGNYPVGQTIVTWTAKDECGNMVMCVDTVIVIECVQDIRRPCGDAVVTCFPGFVSDNPALGIATAMPVIALVNVNDYAAAPVGSNWPLASSTIYHPSHWNTSNLGQVFGLAIDANDNIYTSSSTVYGCDSPTFNQDGPGGFGAIYKIDPSDNVSTFIGTSATFIPNSTNLPNIGSGLGNLCYDQDHNQLFVTNFHDGMIYRIDLATGKVVDRFDPFGSINSPSMNDSRFVELGERTWGVAYNQNEKRIYFSRWYEDRGRPDISLQNEIWSIGLNSSGGFAAGSCISGTCEDGENFELALPKNADFVNTSAGLLPVTIPYSNPVSDIKFSDSNIMLIAERSMYRDCGDAERLYIPPTPTNHIYNVAHNSRVLDFRKIGTSWTLTPLNNPPLMVPSDYKYRLGNHPGQAGNSAGGIDYGTNSFPDGLLPNHCDDYAWMTGDYLQCGSGRIYGLQGTPTATGGSSCNSTLIDYDNNVSGSVLVKIFQGDVEIFKCRQCTIDTATCNDLSATLTPVNPPIQDKCCYNLSLNNGQGPLVTDGVCIDVMTPGWVINTVSTGSGFNYVAGSTNCIQNPGGIPLGLSSNVATICLIETSLSAATPQSILISWMKDSTEIFCYDTLITQCKSPVDVKDTCFVISNVQVNCDPNDDYGYCVCMDVKNISGFNASFFQLDPIPGFTYSNCPGSSTPITSGGLFILSSTLANNASTTLCFKIKSSVPILTTQTICTKASIESLSKCCHSPKEVCFTLKPCCDPCESAKVTLTPVPNIDTCCYRLDLDYACEYDVFDKVELDLLSLGVNIGSFTMLNSAWSPIIKSPGHKICFAPTSGHLTSANDGPLVRFCITDVDDPSDVPQLLSINFLSNEMTLCDTLVKLECMDEEHECMTISNIKAECDSIGKYTITMDVKNNTSGSSAFTATEIIVHTFGVGSVVPTPITFSPPLAPTFTQPVSFTYCAPTGFAGPLLVSYKLRNAPGPDCCGFSDEYRDTISLPPCGPCGYFACGEPKFQFDVEGRPLGDLTAPVNLGFYPGLNNPTIVQDGCKGSQCVELNGATRGYAGESTYVEHGGFLGPDVIMTKDSSYCITFCHKYFKGLAGTTANVEIYTLYPYELVGYKTFTNPGVWETSTFYYTPTSNKTSLYFKNITTDPLDGPGVLRIDDVRIATRTFIEDVTQPEITCPTSFSVNVASPCLYNYTFPVIPVTDDHVVTSFDCTIGLSPAIVGNTYVLGVGTHNISCIAVDSCDNDNSCNYTITVSCDSIVGFCPDNIVQNGDFEAGTGPDQPNTNDIANATGWGSVWTAAFPTPADYRNTGFVPGTVLNPLPASQGDFASMWLTNTTDANKRQAILNNLNSTILPNTGCYDLDFKIACIIPGGVGSPVLQVYGVPAAASPYTLTVDQSMPPNTGLMTGGTPILLGEYTVHTNNCTNNFTPVTFSFNSSIIPAGGINRIFFARRDLMTGELAGDTYIGLDDVCLSPAPCAQECTCNGISDLSIFGSATNFPISCGSDIGKLECNRDFGIHGNINCSSDNCPKTLNWEIKDGSSIVHSGTTTIYNALGHFDIYTFYTSSFVPGRTYTVNLMGNCGMDSCACSFTFTVEDCSGCTCPQNPTFNLMEGDNAPIVVTCNQAPIQIPILECPINPITITSNSLLCTSPNPNIPCPDNVVSWTLDRPVLSNLSGAITGVGFSIGFSAADVADPGTYVLTTITLCGGDSCVCTIKWIQKDCTNEPLCKCGGFSKTKFCLLSTGDAVETECNLPNKVYNLPCPGTSLVNYCGTFKCTPDTCSPPAVNFILTNTNTGAIIHTSGLTLNPMGKFTINLLPGWCNDPSVIYEIKVSGVCGDDTCICTTKFRVDCPQQNRCKCDQKFNTDVAQGFLQSSVAGNCIRKFEPKSLCPGDKVDWYRNGTLVVTTTGMTSATFPILAGFGDVCMIVTRTESPNVICRDTFCSRTYCKPELSETCIEIDNSEMVNSIDGYIDDDGTMINWTKDEGWPYAFANEGLSDGNIMLIASKDMPSAARTNRNGAPPKQGFFTFELDAESYLSTSIPEGSTLELEGITPTGQRVLLSNIDVAGIKKGWDGTIKSEISMPEEIYSVVLRLSTTSIEPALLRIDNFCLYPTVGTNDIQNVNEFSIYPNPTTGELIIRFEEALNGDTKLEVIDFLGRVSNSQFLKSGTIIQAIDLVGKPSGVYVIRLTETGGGSAQRRVIKVE